MGGISASIARGLQEMLGHAQAERIAGFTGTDGDSVADKMDAIVDKCDKEGVCNHAGTQTNQQI